MFPGRTGSARTHGCADPVVVNVAPGIWPAVRVCVLRVMSDWPGARARDRTAEAGLRSLAYRTTTALPLTPSGTPAGVRPVCEWKATYTNPLFATVTEAGQAKPSWPLSARTGGDQLAPWS